MKTKAVMILIGAVIGFALGYLIYGKILGNYVNISALFDLSGGNLGSLGRSIGGVKAIQQKVFVFTGIGATIGLVYAFIRRK